MKSININLLDWWIQSPSGYLVYRHNYDWNGHWSGALCKIRSNEGKNIPITLPCSQKKLHIVTVLIELKSRAIIFISIRLTNIYCISVLRFNNSDIYLIVRQDFVTPLSCKIKSITSRLHRVRTRWFVFYQFLPRLGEAGILCVWCLEFFLSSCCGGRHYCLLVEPPVPGIPASIGTTSSVFV